MSHFHLPRLSVWICSCCSMGNGVPPWAVFEAAKDSTCTPLMGRPFSSRTVPPIGVPFSRSHVNCVGISRPACFVQNMAAGT